MADHGPGHGRVSKRKTTGGKGSVRRSKAKKKKKRLSFGKDVVPISDFINPGKKLQSILRRKRPKN